MYSNLQWLDHAVTPDKTYKMTTNSDGTVTLTSAGTVIQQGTNMSAANFNNIEMGITDHDLAIEILVMLTRNLDDRATDLLSEITPEFQTATLSNSASYPFNNSTKSIALETKRNSTNYTVETEVTESDGNVGEIVITDKQTSGFKIAFTGSATSATVKIKIIGGVLS